MITRTSVFSIVFSLIMTSIGLAQGVKIKNLVDVEGIRTNELVGYGLVVGLNGTGDSLRNSPFTEEMMANMLERLGVNVAGENFRSKNVAAVLLTAELPAFARTGSKIDVAVSTIGDASSLRGGTLVLTQLMGADGEVYALAQGSVIAGGATVEGDAARITQGVPTSAYISQGAQVEREISFQFESVDSLKLALKTPDVTTAVKIAHTINKKIGNRIARVVDPGTILLDLTSNSGSFAIYALAEIENLEVVPKRMAKVVVDQRSGTIVIGESVRVSSVGVSQGNLTLKVQEDPIAVQPNPFAEGETVVLPRTNVELAEEVRPVGEISFGTTLSDVVAGLNALGVSTLDMIDILKTIHAAGALHAELEIL